MEDLKEVFKLVELGKFETRDALVDAVIKNFKMHLTYDRFAHYRYRLEQAYVRELTMVLTKTLVEEKIPLNLYVIMFGADVYLIKDFNSFKLRQLFCGVSITVNGPVLEFIGNSIVHISKSDSVCCVYESYSNDIYRIML